VTEKEPINNCRSVITQSERVVSGGVEWGMVGCVQGSCSQGVTVTETKGT